MSFRYPDQLGLVLEVCQSFAVDNGAFSAWKSGEPVQNWNHYYEWVAELHRYPSFDFAVIPDVIDGDEQANDELVAELAPVPSLIVTGRQALDEFKRLAPNAKSTPKTSNIPAPVQ